MGPFDDLIPQQRPQGPPTSAPRIGQPLVGPPRLPTPQSPMQDALTAEQLRAARLANDATEGVDPPGNPSLQGPEYLRTLSTADREMVQAFSDGRMPMPSQRFLTSPRGQRIMAATLHFDPQFDAANYQTRLATQRNFTSGRRRANLTSLGTVMHHIEGLQEAYSALNNGDFPTYNRLANWLSHEFGSGRPTDFNTSATAVSDELETAIVNSGGTLSGRQGWRELLTSDASPDQAQAAFSRMSSLLHDRINEIGEEYNAGMGRSADPIMLLSPSARRSFYNIQGLTPPDSRGLTVQPGEQVDRTTPTVTGQGTGAPQIAVSHGDVTMDPARERIFQQAERRISTMLKRGVPDAQIRAYGQSQGIDTSPALDFRRGPNWRQWRQRRPNEMYPLQRPNDINRPLGAVEGTVAGAAASGPGTAFINSGNAIIPLPLIARALGGNPEDTRLALAAGQQEHPGYALAGTLAGAAASYNVAGRGANLVGQALENAPRLGGVANFLRTPTGQLGAFAPRAVAGDALYGAIQGEGEGGNPFAAGAENIAGGMLGRAAFRTAGRFAAPTANYAHDPLAGQFWRNRDMRDLYAIGSRPSPGQRFGGLANNIEQRMQDIPLVGDAIRGTRNRARDQFRTGVFNDALGQIDQQLPQGASPTESHQFLQLTTSDAYDEALRNMRFNIDPQATTDIGQLQQRIATLRPEDQNSFNQIWSGAVARRVQDGSISGEDLKAAMSELRQRADALRPDPTRTELADSLDHAQNILDSGARRASPPEAVAALDAADAAYARRVQIENAAKRRGGEMGDFTPLQYDAAVQQGSSGIRNNQYLAGGALNSNLAQQGKMLADTIPDSGTPSRMMSALGVNALAGGGSFVEPHTLAALGMTGLAYAPRLRNLTTGMLAPTENLTRRRLSQFLKDNAGRIGGLGGPLLNYEIPRK